MEWLASAAAGSTRQGRGTQIAGRMGDPEPAGGGWVSPRAMSSMHAIAPDDVVAPFAEAEANERPPLLVLRPLEAFLDRAGLGEGELVIEPVGEGHSKV